MRKIKRALISVYKKDKLKPVLIELKKNNIEIISSGGTFKEIKRLGFKCKEVSDYTNYSEILDGRVKTLNPKIHAGILNIRKNRKHQKQMAHNDYKNIDLIIVNFYPFEKTLDETNSKKTIIENIDIGGPAMVRSAAKNFEDVCVITDITQYEKLIVEIKKFKGRTSINFREKLAGEAFTKTAYYDSKISDYFNKQLKNDFPSSKIISAKLTGKLRYGENPHQSGAIYSTNKNREFFQLSGKELSYNNYNDVFSAINLSSRLPKNLGTVIVKHANPCGVSINKNKIKSYKEALECDPISAFGGVLSFNFKVNRKLAIELNKIFLEVIIANGFENDALKILKKRKNIRLLLRGDLNIKSNFDFISNFNSFLYQSKDEKILDKNNFKVVSKIKPTKEMFKNLIFAFNVCRSVKSNAIVITKGSKTIGIGSGQPSRIDSCKVAITKMNKFQKIDNYDGIIAASDAFFPFVDGIETLVQSGVSAVIQPSGSIRDKEIIKFANQTNTILVFSKTRHFKH